MVSTKVALIYVYTVPFEYLLNDMFKRDFISRLHQVFLWLFFFSFMCWENVKHFVIHENTYTHLYDVYISVNPIIVKTNISQ